MTAGRTRGMTFFFQELVNGITTGALYALVALGFTMVYGVLQLLNFAHGDLYMVGAYVGFFVIQWFGGPSHTTIAVPLLLVIMFVLAGGLVGGLGVAIERFAYRPLRNAPRIAPLITAIGVSFFLESSVQLLTNGYQYNYDPFELGKTGNEELGPLYHTVFSVRLGGTSNPVTVVQLFVVGTA